VGPRAGWGGWGRGWRWSGARERKAKRSGAGWEKLVGKKRGQAAKWDDGQRAEWEERTTGKTTKRVLGVMGRMQAESPYISSSEEV
jgi:hypothetical protein